MQVRSGASVSLAAAFDHTAEFMPTMLNRLIETDMLFSEENHIITQGLPYLGH